MLAAVGAVAALAGGLATAALVGAGTSTAASVQPQHLFGAPTDYGVYFLPDALAVGDVTGDGMPDVVVADDGLTPPGSLSYLVGTGGGSFRAVVNGGYIADTPASLALADLDGDGKPDLITADYGSNAISVAPGNGDGIETDTRVSYATGVAPMSVAVGDVNGDGRLDVAVADYGSDAVSVLLGNGNGSFQGQAEYPAGRQPTSVAIGDLNGDGRPDLAVSDYGAGSVSALSGNGDGTFQPAAAYPAGTNPRSIAITDLNGDSRADLVAANNGDGTVSVLLGLSGGGFESQTAYGVGTAPTSVAVGDLNGDGRPDLVTTNDGGDTVSVLLGNGDGTFGAQAGYTVGTRPVAVAIADLNGDGAPDLAVANESDGTVSILQNTSPAVSTTSTGQTTTTTADTTTSDFTTTTTGSPSAGVTAQVLPALTASLDKASLEFGSLLPGGTTSRSITPTVTSNDSAGYQLAVSRTAFTPGDLPVSIACAACGISATPVPTGDTLLPVAAATGLSANSGDDWPSTLTLGPIPGAARSGNYSSTITFTVVGL